MLFWKIWTPTFQKPFEMRLFGRFYPSTKIPEKTNGPRQPKEPKIIKSSNLDFNVSGAMLLLVGDFNPFGKIFKTGIFPQIGVNMKTI